jgi:hypothetical protein
MNVAEDDREWVAEVGVWTEGRVINRQMEQLT